MKKSSRRSFGKQLAGTLISLPVLGSVAEVYGQDDKKVKSEIQARDREHNTPPPVLIAEGSLTIETMAEFGATPTPAGAGRKRHFMGLGLRRIKHIKIVDGSGEMLYRRDNAPDNVEIRILISHPRPHADTELRMGRASNNLYVDLIEEKEIGGGELITGTGKRKRRYRVRRGDIPMEFKAITVAADAHPSTSILFTVSRDDVDSELKETRIMIWPE